MVYAQQTQREQELIKAVQSAILPWAIGEKLNIQSWDTQEQIDKCCHCRLADCTNCMEVERNTGGRGKKRDTTRFADLYLQGLTRDQICTILNITTRTFYRLVKQFKGE